MKYKLYYAAFFAIVFFSCTSHEKVNEKFIETGYMDSSIKPGDNFFLYVNGKWIDTAKIPATESGSVLFWTCIISPKARLHNILDSLQKASLEREALNKKWEIFMLQAWILLPLSGLVTTL